jgi:hypothetical protein
MTHDLRESELGHLLADVRIRLVEEARTRGLQVKDRGLAAFNKAN